MRWTAHRMNPVARAAVVGQPLRCHTKAAFGRNQTRDRRANRFL